MQIDTFITKKWLAIIALNLFGIFLIYLLSNFITAFLGAIIFYVLFTPLMDKLTEVRKWKETWAALLLILLSFVIILIPILSLSYMLYAKISEVVNAPTSLLNVLHMFDEKMQT
jgi:predicted PurR-regulated permease PerM